MRKNIPFELSKDQSFYQSLSTWLGDIFYDVLPENGYEIRDEQVYMAFQIEKALQSKSVLFAEAGVGTGKTMAYLLPSVAYARYTGKPVIIACSDEALIEQLIKPEGDINRLSELLNLSIDVRLAKSREEYLCLQRLDEQRRGMNVPDFVDEIDERLPEFVFEGSSLQSVYPYGDRKEFNFLTDEEWKLVNYHPVQQCSICEVKNQCGQTISRQFYRQATDLVICSHEFLMEHLWTAESRKRQEQLPLLPEASAIVLDEGHLVEYAAQEAFTLKVQSESLIELLDKARVEGLRPKTLHYLDVLEEAHLSFFEHLRQAIDNPLEEKMTIVRNTSLNAAATLLIQTAEQLLEEFVFEGEMYSIDSYDMKLIEEYLEDYVAAFRLFTEDNEAIDWVEEVDGIETLAIMPELVDEQLAERLFTGKLPIIFSSATLSVDGTFDYLAGNLGVAAYQSLQVASPFDYEEVMKIHVHTPFDKNDAVMELLQQEIPTLLLFSTKESFEQFKFMYETENILFEGSQEMSTLIETYKSQPSVLASYSLWEGLDLPLELLTRVILYDLPFPPNDPIFRAKRAASFHPFEEVDLPFMKMRMKQGVGRLIRTEEDFGTIEVLVTEHEKQFMTLLESELPVKPTYL